MPPSMGGTSLPQLSGQSEMARDASLLVTRAPATTSSRVHNAVNTAKRRSPGEGIGNRCRKSGAGFSKACPWNLKRALGDRRRNPIVCPTSDRNAETPETGQEACPTGLALDGEVEGLAVFGSDGDLLFLRAVLFLPDLNGVSARRQAVSGQKPQKRVIPSANRRTVLTS